MTTKSSTNRLILLTVRIHKIENETRRKKEHNKDVPPHTKATERTKNEKSHSQADTNEQKEPTE